MDRFVISNKRKWSKRIAVLVLVAIFFQLAITFWWSRSGEVIELTTWLDSQGSVRDTYGPDNSYRVINQTSMLSASENSGPYTLYRIRVIGEYSSGIMKVKVREVGGPEIESIVVDNNFDE